MTASPEPWSPARSSAGRPSAPRRAKRGTWYSKLLRPESRFSWASRAAGSVMTRATNEAQSGQLVVVQPGRGRRRRVVRARDQHSRRLEHSTQAPYRRVEHSIHSELQENRHDPAPHRLLHPGAGLVQLRARRPRPGGVPRRPPGRAGRGTSPRGRPAAVRAWATALGAAYVAEEERTPAQVSALALAAGLVEELPAGRRDRARAAALQLRHLPARQDLDRPGAGRRPLRAPACSRARPWCCSPPAAAPTLPAPRARAGTTTPTSCAGSSSTSGGPT